MARSVWLRSEAARDESPNDATIMLASAPLPAPTATRRAFEEEFRRNYPAIRGLLDRHRQPGLGLVVASGDGLEGTAWVPAEPNGLNPVIVGRHTSAEVFLPADPSLSLRHLAVLLSADEEGPVRFRVLDLRTASAFEDEHEERRAASFGCARPRAAARCSWARRTRGAARCSAATSAATATAFPAWTRSTCRACTCS